MDSNICDMALWTTNGDMGAQEADDISFSCASFQDAEPSPASLSQPRLDHEERTQDYRNYFVGLRSEDSPEDGAGRYQLPSPIEEESMETSGKTEKARRREQNRVAQRAFRERKEFKMKQLEKHIAKLKVEYRQLERKHNNLRTAHLRMQSGLKILLEASGTFDEVDSTDPLLRDDT